MAIGNAALANSILYGINPSMSAPSIPSGALGGLRFGLPVGNAGWGTWAGAYAGMPTSGVGGIPSGALGGLSASFPRPFSGPPAAPFLMGVQSTGVAGIPSGALGGLGMSVGPSQQLALPPGSPAFGGRPTSGPVVGPRGMPYDMGTGMRALGPGGRAAATGAAAGAAGGAAEGAARGGLRGLLGSAKGGMAASVAGKSPLRLMARGTAGSILGGLAAGVIDKAIPGNPWYEQAGQGAAIGAGLGAPFGPWGMAIGGAGGGLIGGLTSILGGKKSSSTSEVKQIRKAVTSFIQSVNTLSPDDRAMYLAHYNLLVRTGTQDPTTGTVIKPGSKEAHIWAAGQIEQLLTEELAMQEAADMQTAQTLALQGQIFNQLAPYQQQSMAAMGNAANLMTSLASSLPAPMSDMYKTLAAQAYGTQANISNAYAQQLALLPMQNAAYQQQQQLQGIANQIFQQQVQQSLQPQESSDILAALTQPQQ